MDLYKVTFDDKGAIWAEPTEAPHYETLKLEMADGKRTIQWIIIYAKDEEEGLWIANKVVRGLFQFSEEYQVS